jgi:hypothetical protein
MTTAKKIQNTLVITALTLGAGIGCFFVLMQAVSNAEEVECLKLERQASEFEHFFLTEWQDEMCRTHGIIIGANIK